VFIKTVSGSMDPQAALNGCRWQNLP